MNGKSVCQQGQCPRTVSLGVTGAFAVGLAACLGYPAVSQADRIDEALIRQAPAITKYLAEKKCKNVGVLSFRLQKGSKLPEFRGGLVVDNMAERVQHALIVAANPEAPPIGIVDHASAIAAKKFQHASYRTAADRKQLFSVRYPLMWGSPPAQVFPDVFLTGKVSVASDLRSSTVTIEAFDRGNPGKISPVTQFSVKTDRYVLADLGQGYSVVKTRLASYHRGMPLARDIIESDSSAADGKTEPKVEDGTVCEVLQPNPPADKPFPISWTVYYDGVAQEPAADPDEPGNRNFLIPDPKEGVKVTFGVTNNEATTLGLVLTVNGVSTLYEQRGEADQMLPWVLEPGKEFMIKGFHQEDGKTYLPIVGLSDEESKANYSDLGGDKHAGLIELFVIRPGTEKASQVVLSRSLRRPGPQYLPKGQPTSLAQLQRALSQSAGARATRGLMAWDQNQQDEVLQNVEFQSAPPSEHLVVRYYQSPK